MNQVSDIDNPKWKPIVFEINGLKVTWQEKYGNEKVEVCNGLWETGTQYLLSWKDNKKIIIEKSNLNSLTYEKNK